jgi:hypothetical protein
VVAVPPLFRTLGLNSWVRPAQSKTGVLIIGTVLIVALMALLVNGIAGW